MMWEDRAHPHLTKPPLTQEMLEEWEKRYGLKLPELLVSELKLKNGGCLKPQTFKLGGKIHEIDEIPGIAPEDKFNCLAPLSQWHSGESEGINREKQGDPDKLVPLSGDGHWYYCLDYNDTPAGKPRVCFVDLECGYEKVLICHSFDELIANTYLGDDRPCVSYGTGWETFKVLVNDNVNVGNKAVRNILGIGDHDVRLQYEYRWREETELGECTWMPNGATLQFHFEDQAPTLEISASGKQKSGRLLDGRWFNEEECGRICVYARSIEMLMDAFRQLDAMRRRKKDNAIKLANTWDELMAAAYAGESEPCIKFGEGWDGYTILIDTRSAAGAGQGVILGTKDNEIRIQESQIISNFKDLSYPYLSEYAFPGSYVDLSGLSLSHAHEEDRFPYLLHIHTKKKAVCHSSQKHSGEWMNDEQPDVCDAWLGVERLDDALKAFKKLHEMACMGQGKKKRRR